MNMSKVHAPGWAEAEVRVAIIGDSTLDNILWVTKKDPCIPDQLREAVACGAVVNLAADGYTSGDTLNGCARVISVGMRERFGDPVPFDEDGFFRPLCCAAKLEPPPTHIVLSVGGNDVREILSDMRRLPEIVQGFTANYPQIVTKCQEITPNVILMLQYRPSFHMDEGGYGVYQAIGSLPGSGDSVAKLNQLMENIYAPVIQLAKEHGLAVIDLPRTFDIYDSSLYTHQIEPSCAGGRLIASMLARAIATHKMGSSLYLGVEGDIVTEENTGAGWSIPHDPAKVPGGESQEFSSQEQKVRVLLGMGFSEEKVEQALVASGGDLQDAVNTLLDNQ